MSRFNLFNTNRTSEALQSALDVAAPDSESWLAGQAAYNVAQSDGKNLDESLEAALNVAAPDSESWLAGQAAFNAVFNTTMRQKWRIMSEKAFSDKQQAARQPQEEGNNK